MVWPAQSSCARRSLAIEVRDEDLEGVTLMFAGAWCGQLGVGGWVLMGLFWLTFLGLVLWAVSRLFGRDRGAGTGAGDKPVVDDADNLDLRLARGELDVAEYQTLREELAASTRQ
jgi:uncharacterized membrane protein